MSPSTFGSLGNLRPSRSASTRLLGISGLTGITTGLYQQAQRHELTRPAVGLATEWVTSWET